MQAFALSSAFVENPPAIRVNSKSVANQSPSLKSEAISDKDIRSRGEYSLQLKSNGMALVALVPRLDPADGTTATILRPPASVIMSAAREARAGGKERRGGEIDSEDRS